MLFGRQGRVLRKRDNDVNIYEKASIDAGVLIHGHVQLNSGRHSNLKLEYDRLHEHPQALKTVLGGLQGLVEGVKADLVVPVPQGALELYKKLPSYIPVILTDKYGSRSFGIPMAYHRMIKNAGKIVIGEDVVTTGGASSVMAGLVRELNPEAELHLVGVWQRDKISRRYKKCFKTTQFLIKQTIPSWKPKACLQQECQLEARG